MERIGRKFVVLSGKGGVGKSTVAANLAVALARAGKKVGLLDVDLHGPSIPRMLGLSGQRIGADGDEGIAPISAGPNLLVVSVGLLLGSQEDAVIWRGPMKFNVIRKLLKDVQWGPLDCLVIDSPPGTGDEPLAVAELAGANTSAVVVTTGQDVATADVRRSISFCRSLNLPIVGVVEIMSHLICPHCREKIDLFSSGGGAKLAADAQVPFLGSIPLDPQIVACGDAGRPFSAVHAESPAGQAFARIVEPLLKDPEQTETHGPQKPQQEIQPMKIALPVANGQLCMHFGHCEQFALVEVDANSKTLHEVEYLTPPPHEPGVLPRWLHEQGAQVIIAGGMGRRAQDLFAQNGIEVIVGAPVESPEAIISAYLAGNLESGQNVCDH
jgi:Mrp family chromosome partitioning ATPase/predicted Fe-Mo cluster-binding NifX family protein